MLPCEPEALPFHARLRCGRPIGQHEYCVALETVLSEDNPDILLLRLHDKWFFQVYPWRCARLREPWPLEREVFGQGCAAVAVGSNGKITDIPKWMLPGSRFEPWLDFDDTIAVLVSARERMPWGIDRLGEILSGL
ncbi:MAG: hypothetical protein WBX25_34860 [Rhodomicrobium sp.]